MINGIVWAIFLLAISLPSTVNTPVPPFPGPGPSYLKSNTSVCLPGASARANKSAPTLPADATLPAESLHIKQVVGEDRLALLQEHSVATDASAQGHDHSLRAAFRNSDFGGDGVVLV